MLNHGHAILSQCTKLVPKPPSLSINGQHVLYVRNYLLQASLNVSELQTHALS